ncbi:GNAT family N-acetyltransferase [Rhizobiaceae bacterium n13]|uniref:GNAT family N-acetyltransferase n=1 Tax=Ferirhizobium litorale TaxID=2927786 RepID=UPI0024B2DF5D|nr:GNAT family N-acetyltransferase [Fererhizobium litorale]MDI7863684.1 GNAT family N-acetyltransferase [Fererhizobium litorale]
MDILETERLTVRNWAEEDRDLFHEINADRKVMEFFPFRRTRPESNLLFDHVRDMIRDTGLGFYAVALKETDEAMGFCGLALANVSPMLPDESVEIGWRLATRFWGNGYVTEAATALLGHGFERHGLPEIVSFAVASNRRSIAVMKRIGMQADPSRDFKHPRVPDNYPHLKHHVFYRMTREEWRERQAATP